jgi:tetrahydromethanopterin S-methyltransferase subunit G
MDTNPSGAGILEQKIDALSSSVDQRFGAVDQRFNAIDRQFDGVTAVLVEQRQYTEFAFGRVENRLDRIERKLDHFLDTQSKHNELIERRLQRLESAGP